MNRFNKLFLITLALYTIMIISSGIVQAGTYTITITPSAGGSITCGGQACPTVVNSGTLVSFTAIPNSGYILGRWSGACAIGTDGTKFNLNSCTLPIIANTTLSASFVQPIYINQCQDLQNINNNSSGNYALGKSFTCSGAFTPLKDFEGILDGQGYSISGITINNIPTPLLDYGLFQTVGSLSRVPSLPPIIRNLTLKNTSVTVSVNSSSVGILAGAVNGRTFISNVVIDGGQITGVVAGSLGSIDPNSPDTIAGGIVGSLLFGTINNSAVKNISVVKTLTAGGLAGIFLGYNSLSQIIGSYSSGEIFTVGCGGGLVGSITRARSGNTIIKDSYSLAHVTSLVNPLALGGLVGCLAYVKQSNPLSTIINSYAAGKVDRASYNGGIIGYPESEIQLGGTLSLDPLAIIVTGTYWDKSTTGLQSDPIVSSMGENHYAMQRESTYANWDFVNTWRMGLTYPELKWQPYTVLINVSGNGIVTGEGINCADSKIILKSKSCVVDVPVNSTLTLNATSKSGNNNPSIKWSIKGCTGNTCTFTPDADENVNVKFDNFDY